MLLHKKSLDTGCTTYSSEIGHIDIHILHTDETRQNCATTHILAFFNPQSHINRARDITFAVHLIRGLLERHINTYLLD